MKYIFRGKDIVTGKWVYGDLMHIYGCPHIHHDGGTLFKVMRETVGLYTGNIDKNEKRIFEGDIVRVHDTLPCIGDELRDFTGTVFYHDNAFVIVSEDFTHYRWIDYEIEVIGNIHDNPELLGGEA